MRARGKHLRAMQVEEQGRRPCRARHLEGHHLHLHHLALALARDQRRHHHLAARRAVWALAQRLGRPLQLLRVLGPAHLLIHRKQSLCRPG